MISIIRQFSIFPIRDETDNHTPCGIKYAQVKNNMKGKKHGAYNIFLKTPSLL